MACFIIYKSNDWHFVYHRHTSSFDRSTILGFEVRVFDCLIMRAVHESDSFVPLCPMQLSPHQYYHQRSSFQPSLTPFSLAEHDGKRYTRLIQHRQVQGINVQNSGEMKSTVYDADKQ